MACDAGLDVLDVSNPQGPVLLGTASTCDEAVRVSLYGDMAYLAGASAGLVVVDVTDPDAPQTVGNAIVHGLACGLAVSESYVYLSTHSAFQVAYLSCTIPSAVPPAAVEAPVRLSAWPNPSVGRAGTMLQWTSPRGGEDWLRVLDVGGRLVRTVVEGPMAAGTHWARWDGLDERGRPAASGVYFIALGSGRGQELQRLVVVR